MKKTYMAPSTEVVKIESIETMLEGSSKIINIGETGANGGDALGKDRGIDSALGDLW